jgi:hypothetical protein
VASKINFKKVTERLKDAGVMAAGSVASNYAANFLTGKGVNPKMNAGIRLVAGALLPGFLGESKKAGMLTAFSNGVLAEAAVSLAREFKVPGVRGTDMDDPINGIAGYVDAPLSGTEIDNPVN